MGAEEAARRFDNLRTALIICTQRCARPATSRGTRRSAHVTATESEQTMPVELTCRKWLARLREPARVRSRIRVPDDEPGDDDNRERPPPRRRTPFGSAPWTGSSKKEAKRPPKSKKSRLPIIAGTVVGVWVLIAVVGAGTIGAEQYCSRPFFSAGLNLYATETPSPIERSSAF